MNSRMEMLEAEIRQLKENYKELKKESSISEWTYIWWKCLQWNQTTSAVIRDQGKNNQAISWWIKVKLKSDLKWYNPTRKWEEWTRETGNESNKRVGWKGQDNKIAIIKD